MRAVSGVLQLAIFAAVLFGLYLVLREVLETWDDWVVLAAATLGALGMALALYQSDYPSRTLKRRFGRSSGPDAPAPRTGGEGRRR